MEEKSKNENINLIGDEDIKYIDALYFYIRNAKTLIKLIGLGLTFSLIYIVRLKNIWGGEFQIVLERDNNSAVINSRDAINNRFSQLIGGTQADKLLTEVEILKSPSVLMPIFELSKKRELNLTKKKSFSTFNNWKKDLDISLEKGTSILNIEYKNKRKELIIPTLNEISKVYQSYSSKNKNYNLDKGISFLKRQIKEYKLISDESYKKVQNFATENDLNIILGGQNRAQPQNGNAAPVFKVQDTATEAAITKRNFLEILKNFKKEDYDEEQLIYLSKMNGFIDGSLLEKLNLLEIKIANTKSIYTQDSNKLNTLLQEKRSLIKYIKDISQKKILATIDNLNSKINASKRPDGVFATMNTLNNDYLRDNYTLLELESQLRLLTLEQAKENDPWKLVTNPTLLDERVYPNRTRLMLLYSFAVFILSSLLVFIKEQIDNTIFSKDTIRKNFPYKILEEIPNQSGSLFDHYLEIISKFHLKDIKKIRIFKIGRIDIELFQEFKEKLGEPAEINLEVNNNLLEFDENYSYLFILQSGNATKEDLIKLTNRIGLKRSNVIGLIFLNNKIFFNETNIKA